MVQLVAARGQSRGRNPYGGSTENHLHHSDYSVRRGRPDGRRDMSVSGSASMRSRSAKNPAAAIVALKPAALSDTAPDAATEAQHRDAFAAELRRHPAHSDTGHSASRCQIPIRSPEMGLPFGSRMRPVIRVMTSKNGTNQQVHGFGYFGRIGDRVRMSSHR